MGERGGAIVPTPATMHTESSNSVNGSGRELTEGSYSIASFGPAPTTTEVESVISDISELVGGTITRSSGEWGLVADAINMMKSNTTIKKLVVSIANDASVWNAILNTKAVHDFLNIFRGKREEFAYQLTQGRTSSSSKGAGQNATSFAQELKPERSIIQWIFEYMRSTFMELLEKLVFYLYGTQVFNSINGTSVPKLDDEEKEKLENPIRLSIITLLTVLVTRIFGM